MDFALTEGVAILRHTPGALRSLLSDLSDPWVRNDEGPTTWSPYDVLGHLIHGEETDWIPRARLILEHGESRAFAPVDRFAFKEKSRGKGLDDLLDTFEALRFQNLRDLDALALTGQQLERRGTHPELGGVTLAQLLAAWVVHDLSHIGQIVRVMARQYDHAVGPWKVYLPMLESRRVDLAAGGPRDNRL